MYEGWFQTPVPRAIIDTLTLAKKLKIPGRHALGNLCARYDITIGRAHSADADAGATLLLLWSMMQNYPNQFRGDLDDLQDMLAGRQQNSDRLGPSLVDLEPVDGTNGRLRHSDQELLSPSGNTKAGRYKNYRRSMSAIWIGYLPRPLQFLQKPYLSYFVTIVSDRGHVLHSSDSMVKFHTNHRDAQSTVHSSAT